MTHSDYLAFLTNMIGAVETGGQVYGKRRYDCYTPPYTNSDSEHTITLGWGGFYGHEARKLVQRIYNMDPATFRTLDGAGIEGMLPHDWVAERWKPTATQKAALIRIISSQHGQTCQDALFMELAEKYITACEADYTKDKRAVAMYCETRHLGGKSGVDRIFQRITSKVYSLDNIMAALKQDQSSSKYAANGVGCRKYWSRHTACVKMIEEHLTTEETMTPKELTKIFMREQSQKNLTGYTPTGSGCFKNAGAWTKVPKAGYVVYFWGKPSGESNKRVCHTGIVEKVDTANKTFGTIEGNTSSSTWTTNGGCVARHTYSYANVGGQNRVHGFGIPDFEGAGVTPEQYVKMAQSYIGYEEKKSNKDLDDFHANKGSNNYTKFQRDCVGYTGDQWCHYFVCAIALYCIGGDTGKSGTSGGSGGYMITLNNVRNGSKGADVNLLQRLLDQAGFKGADGNRLTIDGDCGPNTVYAIKQYQAKMGLEVDGDCGPKTWAKIIGK